VIIQFSRRYTGTFQVENVQKEETKNTTLNAYSTINNKSLKQRQNK
jgi:metal-dependent HD superfamily phosphatase/phosphodiesterase